MELKGKAALVTGGSRGIGRAVCLELARRGACVAVNYAGNAAAAEETVESCKAMGVDAFSVQADVADAAACDAMVKEVLSRFGRLDILVNNAGITRDGLVYTMKESDFDAVLDTNLKGAFHLIKHCYPIFVKKRAGKIINISSVSGLMGNGGQANYSASKAGLIGLTKSVARELAGRGVCCIAIAPGFIDTDMTAKIDKEGNRLAGMIPLKRMGQPEDVANLAVFLAGNGSDYITGEVIRVDGGLAM